MQVQAMTRARSCVQTPRCPLGAVRFAACRLAARQRPVLEQFINNTLWAYAKNEFRDEEVFAALAVKAKQCLTSPPPVSLRVRPLPTPRSHSP